MHMISEHGTALFSRQHSISFKRNINYALRHLLIDQSNVRILTAIIFSFQHIITIKFVSGNWQTVLLSVSHLRYVSLK